MSGVQQFDLLKKSAVTAIQADLEAAVAASASAAAASALAADGSASDSAASALASANSASDSLASANAAAASYDSFDDRYLGEKASDPTLDNDGNALLEGALYWNNVEKEMRVYNGTTWQEVTTGSLNIKTTRLARALAADPAAGDGSLLLDYNAQGFGSGDDYGINLAESFAERHTIVRNTVKNVLGKRGQIIQYAANEPAYEWDAATGKWRLSIEESRTNYITNNTTGLTWSVAGSGVVVTERTETVKGVSCKVLNVAHDGLGSSGGVVITPSGLPSSVNCNPSVFVKNVSNTASLRCRDGSNPASGEVTFIGIPSDGEFHRVGAGISSVTITSQYNTNTTNAPSLYFASTNSSAREFEICMPMMEVGTNTSSLILTSGTTITRLADVVTVPDLSGWFNASEGEIVIEWQGFSDFTGRARALLALRDAASTDWLIPFVMQDGRAGVAIREASVDAFNLISTTQQNESGSNVLKLKYGSFGVALTLNGAAEVSTSSTVNGAAFTRCLIGQGVGDPAYFNGSISSIKYYPTREG